jgi:hypothetical protein
MKTLISFLFLCGILPVMAQQPIEVKIEERPSSTGVHSAFEMVVPQATTSDAIDLWKQTIIPRQLFRKTPKMEKIKDEWWVNNVLVSDITSMPLTVITQVSTFPGHIYVRVFLQSEGGFLGSAGSSEQTNSAAARFIRNYGVELYRQAVGKELRTEERVLQTLENDMKKLMRKNKSFGNKIEDVQNERATLADEASYQRTLLGNDPGNPLGVIGETPRADVESQLKSTEKDIKKANKAEKRYNRKVGKNEKAQSDKAAEIDRQKTKITEVKNKLDNIR